MLRPTKKKPSGERSFDNVKKCVDKKYLSSPDQVIIFNILAP